MLHFTTAFLGEISLFSLLYTRNTTSVVLRAADRCTHNEIAWDTLFISLTRLGGLDYTRYGS